jgi:photosystem II stability/assembly factor-like uncharacterized protein
MRLRGVRIAAALAAGLMVVGLAVAAPAGAARLPDWHRVDTGSKSHFRGLAVVSSKVVWLGGYNGTVLRTTDGGATWTDVSPAGAGTLQFRDISASDADHAVAMAAGTGTDSRLYVTSDGGQTWRVAYENSDPAAFFDCMSFSTPSNGLVLSDPVDGKFRILSTKNGGQSWQVLPNTGMPAALDGEFGFAASGECLTTQGHDAWFGSGGGSVSRIYHSTDRGRTWTVVDSPIGSSPSGGVFGLAFQKSGAGVAVGGDFADPSAAVNVAAYSDVADGPWTSAATQPSGYRSGVTFVPGTAATAIAVGLTGSDISSDGGRNWTTFATGQFDTVSCAADGACWASGDRGRVAVLRP